MALGPWIIEMLMAHNMSRAELIRRTGYSKGQVSKWINGESSETSAQAVLAIAHAFRVSPVTVLAQLDDEHYSPAARDIGYVNLPPHPSRGEVRLVEHLAWAVRHWRIEQIENEEAEPRAPS